MSRTCCEAGARAYPDRCLWHDTEPRIDRREVWTEVRRWWREQSAVSPLHRFASAGFFSVLFIAGAAVGPAGEWRWWLAGSLTGVLLGFVLAGLYTDWRDARRRLERKHDA